MYALSTPREDIIGAYQGVERLDAFTPAELDVYRRQLIERTASQASFIEQHAASGASMLEIGAGNGRLLIALAERGLLGDALGIDVASSRIEFARAWALDHGLDWLRFEIADARAASMPHDIDVVACITGTFAYFDAIEPGAGRQILSRIRASLKPGGLLVLELYPHPTWRQMLENSDEKELRLWQELPNSDPWRFYLSRLRFSPNTQILTHDKTFIHRSTGEVDEGRQEHIRLYDAPTICSELTDAGFHEIKCHGGWAHEPWQPDNELLVVSAQTL